MDVERPLCKCHGLPMLKDGFRRTSHGKPCEPAQDWRCAIRKRAEVRGFYYRLEGVAWSKRLLQMRRACAVHARQERELRGGEEIG